MSGTSLKSRSATVGWSSSMMVDESVNGGSSACASDTTSLSWSEDRSTEPGDVVAVEKSVELQARIAACKRKGPSNFYCCSSHTTVVCMLSTQRRKSLTVLNFPGTEPRFSVAKGEQSCDTEGSRWSRPADELPDVSRDARCVQGFHHSGAPGSACCEQLQESVVC